MREGGETGGYGTGRVPLGDHATDPQPVAGRHAAALPRWRSAVDGSIDAVAKFAAVLFPVECPVCLTLDVALCRGCLRRFRSATQAQPPAMFAETGAQALPRGWPVVAAGSYRDASVASVMLAFKDHGRTNLALPLAAALARAVSAAALRLGDSGPDSHRPSRTGQLVLVPVPASATSMRRRGYAPVELLLRTAREAGLSSHNSLIVDALRVRRVSPVSAHRGLNQGARARKVAGSMTVRPPAEQLLRELVSQGARVIVVDDVLTTGSTLGEAHRALSECGLPPLAAAVVARVPPPAGDQEEDDEPQVKLT